MNFNCRRQKFKPISKLITITDFKKLHQLIDAIHKHTDINLQYDQFTNIKISKNLLRFPGERGCAQIETGRPSPLSYERIDKA